MSNPKFHQGELVMVLDHDSGDLIYGRTMGCVYVNNEKILNPVTMEITGVYSGFSYFIVCFKYNKIIKIAQPYIRKCSQQPDNKPCGITFKTLISWAKAQKPKGVT